MSAVLFWTGVAALAVGCLLDRYDRRRFERQAAESLAPVRLDWVDREVAAILRDDIFAELDECWAADHGIDLTTVSGEGFR